MSKVSTEAEYIQYIRRQDEVIAEQRGTIHFLAVACAFMGLVALVSILTRLIL